MAARGDILVGAGTVLTVAQVDQAVGAGARFVVSPGLSRAIVERCQEHGVFVLPCAVTATEVQTALELGLSTLKFFPAGTSGALPRSRLWLRPSAMSASCPLAVSGPRTWPSTWPLPRSPLSAAHGWSPATRSRPVTSLVSSSSPPKPSPSPSISPRANGGNRSERPTSTSKHLWRHESMKILVTPTSIRTAQNSDLIARLGSVCDEIVYNPHGRPLQADELLGLLSDCEGYIAGLDFITADVIRACPR